MIEISYVSIGMLCVCVFVMGIFAGVEITLGYDRVEKALEEVEEHEYLA